MKNISLDTQASMPSVKTNVPLVSVIALLLGWLDWPEVDFNDLEKEPGTILN